MPIPWVVKLGGSLAEADSLRLWLAALAESEVVIVPGGGPFADQVRRAQEFWRFDEDTAHIMAILAMRQYGVMLAGLHPGFATATHPDAMRNAPMIWLPDPEALNPAEIPASWDVTSDSLAAWLARKLGAAHLLLVKSAPIPPGNFPVSQLVAANVVDPAFPRFMLTAGCSVWLARREDYALVGQGFRQPDAVFTRVLADAIPREVPPYGD